RNLADAPMSMRDYFGDSLGIDYYFRVPRSYSRRGIFSIDEPCQTIRGVDRPIPPGYPGHPSDPVEIGPQVRALTIEERSYVQTFPRDFVFQGNKTDLNQMIGNAVPVKLAEYVATALRTYDRKPKRRKENAND
ncbi:DNA cytosine methyltransferase, partial [Anaeroglobus sp. AF13-6AC]